MPTKHSNRKRTFRRLNPKILVMNTKVRNANLSDNVYDKRYDIIYKHCVIESES